MKKKFIELLTVTALGLGAITGCGSGSGSNTDASSSESAAVEITNVSYDPTRELYTTPMLTTVEISKTDMGRFALYLLLDRLNGGHKNIARIELQCRQIKRDSCTLAEDSRWCEYYI